MKAPHGSALCRLQEVASHAGKSCYGSPMTNNVRMTVHTGSARFTHEDLPFVTVWAFLADGHSVQIHGLADDEGNAAPLMEDQALALAAMLNAAHAWLTRGIGSRLLSTGDQA